MLSHQHANAFILIEVQPTLALPNRKPSFYAPVVHITVLRMSYHLRSHFCSARVSHLQWNRWNQLGLATVRIVLWHTHLRGLIEHFTLSAGP